jgi:hypothetical protein
VPRRHLWLVGTGDRAQTGEAESVTLKPATAGVVSAEAITLVSANPVDNRPFTYTYDQNRVQTKVKDGNPNELSDTFKVSWARRLRLRAG